MTSIVSNRDRDCFGCRIVSGTGLIGIGGYLAYYARKNPTVAGKVTIYSLSTAFTGLGVARYTQLYPFDKGERKPEARLR